MKKSFFLIFIFFTIFPVLNSQSLRLGGGLNFGTGFHYNNTKKPVSEEVLNRGPLAGIHLNGIIDLNLPVKISPSISFLMPRNNYWQDTSGNYRTKVSAMMFDLNGHYIFYSPDKFGFYALAGINITLTRLTWLNSNTHSPVDAPLGLNLGAGATMKLTEQLDLNSEIKWTLGKYPQLVLNAGLLINLDVLIKN